MMRRRHDDVLTDYVRERLDRLVADGLAPDHDEAGLQTVVRPRPVLGRGPVVSEFAAAGSEPRRAASEAGPGAAVGGVERSVGWWPGLGQFTSRHVMVIAAVLAIGVLIAAYAVTRARAVPVEASVPVVVTAEEAPAASQPEASPTPEPIRIHVLGHVREPGVHRLPVGARVADAVEAAGGFAEDARPGELNLAQVLADGQQVLIGGPGRPSEVRGGDSGGSPGGSAAAGGTAGTGPAGTKLNLNTANATQLDALPGVGPVTAEKIIAWRTQHGKFTRIEELQEVPGVGPKTFAELAPHLTV
ncbi:MAG: helix-hairpin-helix domain-containing protein [Propionibacteriaceae bacterium]|nr:helix-hairpin-helix domain-containing protein [Propionibacteriaceae bacterium]